MLDQEYWGVSQQAPPLLYLVRGVISNLTSYERDFGAWLVSLGEQCPRCDCDKCVTKIERVQESTTVVRIIYVDVVCLTTAVSGYRRAQIGRRGKFCRPAGLVVPRTRPISRTKDRDVELAMRPTSNLVSR